MTTPVDTIDPADTKREEMKARIETAEARNEARAPSSLTEQAGEKAVEAKDGFTAFVREHPVATVAGGLAIGMLVAGMFKGPRRAAAAGGAKAAGIAAIGSELAMAFMGQLVDTAGQATRAGGDKLEDMGDAMGDTARSLRREATYRVGGASDSAKISARKLGKGLTRSLRHS